MGLAAALLPWPDGRDSVGAIAGEVHHVDLLSPRGALLGAPTRVCWSSSAPARLARVRVVDRRGAVVVERTVGVEPGCRRLGFTEPERERIAAAAAASVELSLMTASGELLAQSAPARFALPSQDPAQGW